MNNSAYILSAYSFIFSETLEQILDVGYQSREGHPIPSFDENVLLNLCTEAQQIFEREDNVLKIEGDLIIVGDIHGSLHDLLRILKFIHDNDSKVLFLGDYVDRGNFSLECITILFALKVKNPDKFYLIRGNHEFDQLCSQYGFKEEILNYYNPKKSETDNSNDEYFSEHTHIDCYKYTEKLYDQFVQVFSYLPICAIVNETTFCIHGGLSPKFDHIDDINSIHRPIKTFEESGLLSDLVWGDPSHGSTLFDENPRGRGFMFNGEAIRTFLMNNSLSRIIRGHQCVRKGLLSVFNDKLITVFSASSYDKLMGNSSSLLQLFQKDDTMVVTTFIPIRRLMKNETVYYKVQTLDKSDANKNYISLIHPTMFPKAPVRKIPHKNFIPLCKKGVNDVRRNSEVKLTAPLAKSKFVTTSRKSYQFDQKQFLPIINSSMSSA